MNLQELQTIKGHNLPIKIFVLDNKGYGMIKQTQSNWKGLKNKVACEPPMADLKKIADCFGFKYTEIENEKDCLFIDDILKTDCPMIIRVIIPDGTKIEPKLKYGDEFDDLTPKLSKRERREIENILKS